jgi:hypothetical protein
LKLKTREIELKELDQDGHSGLIGVLIYPVPEFTLEGDVLIDGSEGCQEVFYAIP